MSCLLLLSKQLSSAGFNSIQSKNDIMSYAKRGKIKNEITFEILKQKELQEEYTHITSESIVLRIIITKFT